MGAVLPCIGPLGVRHATRPGRSAPGTLWDVTPPFPPSATPPTGHVLTVADRRDALVDRLTTRLPRVGVASVVLDRTARPAQVPGEAADDGFTWDEHDAQDPTWWPQGVASAGERLLVSWYAKRRWGVFSLGSRLSVVDPAARRYAHVLLVSPRRLLGRLSMGAVRVHAGGIAVLGDLVYVADTRAGVRVFRLGDLARVPRRRLDALLPWRGAGTRTLGRRLTGGFTAYGYGHVLPQLLRLRAEPGLRWSFLSVGRVEGRLSLVVGEYGRKGTSPRLARYPLDPATGLPELDADGRCAPLEVHTGQPHRMQGVAVDGTTWWVSASSGQGNPGDLHVGRPGSFRRHKGVLPPGPEDLEWSRPGEALWCVSEWPGARYVFPVDARRWVVP